MKLGDKLRQHIEDQKIRQLAVNDTIAYDLFNELVEVKQRIIDDINNGRIVQEIILKTCTPERRSDALTIVITWFNIWARTENLVSEFVIVKSFGHETSILEISPK